MSKSEVYNWRVDRELKQRLEAAAHAEGISIAGVLDRAARDWLIRRAAVVGEEKRQAELHALALSLVGKYESDDHYSKEKLRARVLARRKRYPKE